MRRLSHAFAVAAGLADFAQELAGHKFTPKGMLQLSPKQEISVQVLKAVFERTLKG